VAVKNPFKKNHETIVSPSKTANNPFVKSSKAKNYNVVLNPFSGSKVSPFKTKNPFKPAGGQKTTKEVQTTES
jgi:hypothetical protein